MGLPICEECPGEVKPGEDLCWACLGETIPKDEVEFTFGDAAGVFQSVYIPINAQSYTWTTDHYTAIINNTTITNATVGGVTYTIPPITVSYGDTIEFKWTSPNATSTLLGGEDV